MNLGEIQKGHKNENVVEIHLAEIGKGYAPGASGLCPVDARLTQFEEGSTFRKRTTSVDRCHPLN